MTAKATRAFKIFTVDAFTQEAFRGNAATVVFLDHDQDIPDELKQLIAAEMKTSETAFVSKKESGDTLGTAFDFFLRWFTPKNEVPLCGHATLATAAALFEEGNKNKVLNFDTKAGILTAQKTECGRIALNLPARTSQKLKKSTYEDLSRRIVGEDLEAVNVLYSSEEMYLMLRLDDNTSLKQFEEFHPDFEQMMAFDGGDVIYMGVIVTLKGSRDNGCVRSETGEIYDFVSRFFAPWYGVPEDPVTGSAHGVLGPYWAEQLNGKCKLLARQASERGGDLLVTVRQDGRVDIEGHWVCVRKGEVFV